MAASDRPGGLTTLAVVNFLWAFVDFLGCIGHTFALVSFKKDPEDHPFFRPEIVTPEQVEVYNVFGASWSIMSAMLLVLVGVGYLKQKRMLGYWLGNFYAVVGIPSHLFLAIYWPVELGGASMEAFMKVFYPALTLLLLNFVFRRDLSR